jgi:hypothetical protein
MIAFVFTAWITIISATLASLGKWERIKRPPLIKFAIGAEDLLGPLCDLQAVTGTAIVIAGFAQWHSISYYHREFVTSYWYLTSNSFWTARRAYMYESVNSHKASVPGISTQTAPERPVRYYESTESTEWTTWRVYARRVLITICVALGLAWATSSLIIETQNWNEEDPERCYYYNDVTYTNEAVFYTGAMLIGLLIYWVLLLFSFWDQEGIASQSYNSWFESIIDRSEMKRYHHAQASPMWSTKIAAFFWRMVSWALRILRGIIAVWSYGKSPSPEFFVLYYVFVSWNTWDIIMLKVSNKPLVDDKETETGFGQVLAIVILYQIFLNVVDIWKGKPHSAKRTFLPLTMIRSIEEREEGGHVYSLALAKRT